MGSSPDFTGKPAKPDFTGLHVKRRLSLEESGARPFLYKQYLDKRLNPRWTTSIFMEQLMAYIYYLENNRDVYGNDGWVQGAHRLTMKWCERLENLEKHK